MIPNNDWTRAAWTTYGTASWTPDPADCTDADNDTYAIEGGDCGQVDCNDSNAAINPGATEICEDSWTMTATARSMKAATMERRVRHDREACQHIPKAFSAFLYPFRFYTLTRRC